MASRSLPSGLHSGLYYYDFMAELSRKRSTQRYLEIGVSQGAMLSRIAAKVAVGVDPSYSISVNVAQDKERVTLLSMPSDLFFARPDMVAQLAGPPDLAFLDGMHNFEFLLRDFANTERICGRNSLIAMHDCLPVDGTMAIRHAAEWHARTSASRYPGAWTGDVWKVVPILQRYRPDLNIVCADCGPTGLVLVSNLDPSSTVLLDRYFEIVKEFGALGNDEESIAEHLYGRIDLVSAEVLLRENDHSLSFRI